MMVEQFGEYVNDGLRIERKKKWLKRAEENHETRTDGDTIFFIGGTIFNMFFSFTIGPIILSYLLIFITLPIKVFAHDIWFPSWMKWSFVQIGTYIFLPIELIIIVATIYFVHGSIKQRKKDLQEIEELFEPETYYKSKYYKQNI